MNFKNTILLFASFHLFILHADNDSNKGQVEYTFFDKGKSCCEIVIPEKAEDEELEAAKLMKDIFQKIGNVDTAITKAPSSGKTIHINIGQTQLGMQSAEKLFPSKLDMDGYLIHPSDENNIVIIGKRPLSTFYGVIDFLEQYAGVLWIWPNGNGKVIPAMERLTVSIKKQIEEPIFKARRFSGIEEGQGKYWRINQESKGLKEIRSQFSHNVRRVILPEYWEKHPEYFNMRYGKRIKPAKFSQACISNPEVVKLYVEAAKKQFKSYPWLETFSASPGDGGFFCECDKCRALDIPGVEGNSDRYFTFVNAVADGIKKDFPDRKISCLAYGKETCEPPVNVKLRPNVMPYLVVPSIKDHHQDVIAWSNVAQSLGVYFHLHGKAVPKFFPHKFAEYLKFLHEHKVTEVYAEVYQDNQKTLASYELDGPRVWIIAKLLWNPYDDVDKLMGNFCSNFYGVAAKPMLKYYQQCEKAWERTNDPFDFRREYASYEFDIYTLEDINIMTDALNEALNLAEGDKIVQARLESQKQAISFLAAYCQFQDIPKATAELPMNNTNDALAILDVINKRALTAAKYNKNTPLRFISKDVTEYLDKQFSDISTKQGKNAVPFWQTALGKYPLISSFIQAQILGTNDKKNNIAENPGFETAAKKTLKTDPEWESLNVPGWSKWSRPNAPGKISITAETARNGKNSLLLEGCNAGSANQTLKVKAGQRYKISCWIKTGSKNTNTSKNTGKLTISWKSPAGKWLNKANIISIPSLINSNAWQALSTIVTVPVDADHMVIMLGAEEQGDSGEVWFDDVSIEPLFIQEKKTN